MLKREDSRLKSDGGGIKAAGAQAAGGVYKRSRIVGVALALSLAAVMLWVWPTKAPVPPRHRQASVQTAPAEQTRRLLQQAREAFIAYNLTTPPGASAYHYYSEVLRYDPNNGEAQAGLRAIADRYAQMADEQMKLFQYEKARQYIEKGLMIVPDHPQLLALEGDANDNLPRRVIKSFKRIFR